MTGVQTCALPIYAAIYGGTDEGNLGGRHTDAIPTHGYDYSLLLDIPPLAIVVFKQ